MNKVLFRKVKNTVFTHITRHSQPKFKKKTGGMDACETGTYEQIVF